MKKNKADPDERGGVGEEALFYGQNYGQSEGGLVVRFCSSVNQEGSGEAVMLHCRLLAGRQMCSSWMGNILKIKLRYHVWYVCPEPRIQTAACFYSFFVNFSFCKSGKLIDI